MQICIQLNSVKVAYDFNIIKINSFLTTYLQVGALNRPSELESSSLNTMHHRSFKAIFLFI